jgi:hypothetical protein
MGSWAGSIPSKADSFVQARQAFSPEQYDAATSKFAGFGQGWLSWLPRDFS